MTKKIFLKLVLFLIGFFLLWHYLSIWLTLKEYPIPGPNVNILVSPYVLSDKQNGFYSEKKNSLDVVFLGSSNVHCNINPNVIWNEYGITSYDFSSDQQELGTTFYYLQQMFETQSPKAVIIDVYLDGSEPSIDSTQAHFSFDHMKNDIFRFLGIWNRVGNDRLEVNFPLIAYHDRWKEIDRDDFRYRKYQHNILNGSFIYMAHSEKDRPEIPDTIPVGTLSERTVYWLDQIRKICEQNHSECIFIKTPFANYSEEWFSYFEAVERYCGENDVPFLNMNKLVDDMGIDFSSDYADDVHMNWYGMEKLSSYLGKYLQNRFRFEDKRNDPVYARWNDDYDQMMYYINNFDELFGSG